MRRRERVEKRERKRDEGKGEEAMVQRWRDEDWGLSCPEVPGESSVSCSSGRLGMLTS